ncbi:MAG: hypothetical protein KA180_10275, partial [Gemmatimonadales bacterium]|nr:hypothetical protein [Gemmatimonadales bacterium]
QRVTDMRLSDLAEAIRPSMIAATAMMAMVAATRALLPASTGLPAQFFTAVGVGALTYVLVLILGFRERLAGVRALVGELRR